MRRLLHRAGAWPGNTCPIHEIPLEREREENWFFRLSAFEDDLKRLYAERPDFVVPEHRRNEALSFIEQGLEDVSLSRPKLKWGMPLPWDPSQRMYVWFDALLNYYTALSFARDDGSHRALLAGEPARARQGHPQVPRRDLAGDADRRRAGAAARWMVIHGFLLMGEKKMSKSLGNVLDPNEVIDRFGADALRFYCFREVSFGQDGSVSAAGFEARYERLANDWGNLASRTLAMIERYRAEVVPDAELDPELESGDDAVAGIDGVVRELLERAEITQALSAIWARVRRLNRYVEESRPWDLAKDDSEAARLDQVLYNLAEGCGCWRRAPSIHAGLERPAARRARRGTATARRLRRRRGAQRIERIPLFRSSRD